MPGHELALQRLEIDATQSTVKEVALMQALAVDLIVASPAYPYWLGAGAFDMADDLVIAGGRPVLIVPNAARTLDWPPNVVVGWNGQREAMRRPGRCSTHFHC